MQSESVSNKETKRTFAGNARYRQILLLDLKLWGCEGRVAACYYKERDYMERANTEELGNGERPNIGEQGSWFSPWGADAL